MSHDADITWNWPDNAYGTVQQAAAFHSRILEQSYGYGLYLPPSYADSPRRRFPVLYWLHGYTSRPHYAGYFTERLHAAILRGEAPEMIVIGVNGLYSALFCNDESGDRPVESVIMRELIPHVDATYRTISDPAGRGLEGFSRGGFGAAHLAFKHPDTFGVLSMLAGAFHRAEELPQSRPWVFRHIFGSSQERWNRENGWDLAEHAAKAGRAPTAMRMIVGKQDHGQYEGNLQFHNHLVQLGLACELTVVPRVDHTVRGLYDHYAGNPFAFFRALTEE